MKKLLALLLIVVMIFSVFSITVSAEQIEITDAFVNAVQKEHPHTLVEKEDINIYYMYELTSDVFLVKYYLSGLMYPDDMVEITMGNYVVTSSRPEPVVYAFGVFFDLDEAYEYSIIGEKELELMCELPKLNIKKVKIQPELIYEAVNYKDDEFINVRFTLVGSEKELTDIEGWGADFSSASVKLREFYESLHQSLLNDVLKNFDYIDVCHNNGISVVKIKKADIEKISQSELVVLMEYISPVHMKYIETYNPRFKEYVYKNERICYEKGEITYRLIKAYDKLGSPLEVYIRIGDVIMGSSALYSNFNCQYGLYDEKEDKFYDLYDLKDDYVKYCNIEMLLLSYCDGIPAGDSDGDTILTVMDATSIQRSIAKLDDYGYIDIYVSDIDKDGAISVLDATKIQRKIACVE